MKRIKDIKLTCLFILNVIAATISLDAVAGSINEADESKAFLMLLERNKQDQLNIDPAVDNKGHGEPVGGFGVASKSPDTAVLAITAEGNERGVTPYAKTNGISTFTLSRDKPWYSKLNYFITTKQEERHVDITRRIGSPELDEESLVGTYNATLLSLTAGGNLFARTSFNLDLTLNRYNLSGEVGGFNKETVKYQRNQFLTEIFVEYDLGQSYTLGFDLYYGGDRYRDEGSYKVHADHEVGADLMVSRKFGFESSNARLDYIFGHRVVHVDLVEEGKISRNSHNLLSTITHNFTYDLSVSLNSRISYFPKFDEFNYWEARYIYSLGSELNYRLWQGNEVSLSADIMRFGGQSTVHIFAIRFEHLLGAKKSKRRQRRYKIPNLLIK